MNFYGINGGSINGAIYALVLATSSLVCSAEITAQAVRQQDALAPVYSGAVISSEPTVYRHVTASLQTTGGVFPGQTTQYIAVSSECSVGAEIVAYVSNTVYAEATVYAGADMYAVVANALGFATMSGGAGLETGATRVQFVSGGVGSAALLDITVEPFNTQFAQIDVVGGAALFRGEPSTQTSGEGFQRHDGYAFIDSTAEILSVVVRIAQPMAVLLAGSEATPISQLVQSCGFVLETVGAVVLVEPHIETLPFVQLLVGAGVSATGTRVVKPSSSVVASASIYEAVGQQHSAVATPIGGATVISTAVKKQMCTVDLGNSANMVSVGTNYVFPACTASAAAELNAQAVNYVYPLAELTGTSVIQATAVLLKFANGDIHGACETAVEAVLTKKPEASIETVCEITTAPNRWAWLRDAEVGLFNEASGYFDTIANPESFDPESRTFMASAREVVFLRPFVETEFKRVA